MKRLIAGSVAVLLAVAMCLVARADDYDSIPWASRVCGAELIVSGTVTRGGLQTAEVRVEKVWKGTCGPVISVRRFADTFSGHPRRLSVGDRCILLLERPYAPSMPPADPSWECLNPYDGRLDVLDGKAYGSLVADFTRRAYPLEQVERAIVAALPPVAFEIKPLRDRLQADEPLMLRVTLRNVSERPVTLSSRDLRAATVYAVIPEPRRGPLEIYTPSSTFGMSSRKITKVPLTLRPGEAFSSTRRVATVEYKWRHIPFPVGVSRVRLALRLDRPALEVWSNSVVFRVGTSARRRSPRPKGEGSRTPNSSSPFQGED
jgi:hypothetical protein